MLEMLRTGLGFRIAMSLAMFAALCFVAPPAVMAFGHGETTVHCLSKANMPHHGASHHGMGDHVDHLGQKTEANQAQVPSDRVRGCCGLFCLNALLPPSEPKLAVNEPHAKPRPRLEFHFSGLIPGLLDRPPIFPLSV